MAVFTCEFYSGLNCRHPEVLQALAMKNNPKSGLRQLGSLLSDGMKFRYQSKGSLPERVSCRQSNDCSEKSPRKGNLFLVALISPLECLFILSFKLFVQPIYVLLFEQRRI